VLHCLPTLLQILEVASQIGSALNAPVFDVSVIIVTIDQTGNVKAFANALTSLSCDFCHAILFSILINIFQKVNHEHLAFSKSC